MAGAPWPGSGEINGVEVVLLDQPVHVNPDKALSRVGTPVSKQAILDVLGLERLAQKRV